MIKNGVVIEYCSGSVGHLNDKWLKEFYDCSIGRKLVGLAKLDCDIPPVEVVFPTYTDVEQCDDLARTVRTTILISASPRCERVLDVDDLIQISVGCS